MDVCVMIPVFNDWESLNVLLERLGTALSGRPRETFRVLVIDDGSTAPGSGTLTLPPAYASGTILHLRRNLGHQRAIAIGLAWLQATCPPAAVAVMDGDGEDKPEDLPRLLDRFAAGGGGFSVFAERTRRSEGLVFTTLYKLYQLGHAIATGLPVKVGNFSVLSRDHLDRIVTSSNLWSHYAAAAMRLGVPMDTVPTHRGTRYRGSSKMNFISLVRHGLGALAVNAELIAVRSLVAMGLLSIVGFALLCATVGIRVFTNLAVPGWTTYVSALVLIILLQMLSITFSVTLHALAAAGNLSFLPARDYPYFVGSVEDIASLARPRAGADRE